MSACPKATCYTQAFYRIALVVCAALACINARAEEAERARTVVRRPVDRAPTDLSELRAMQARVQQLSKQAIAATVAVQVGSAQGSGVIISPDGYVLTAAHVSGKPGRQAWLVLDDGSKVSGQTLGIYRTLDAGLIKIKQAAPDGEWPYAKMGDSMNVKPGQWCLVAGHPGGFEDHRPPVVRLGRVLSFHEDSTINTDCTLIGGDSGGPLFNMDGEVIGVNSRIGNPLTVNLHVPVNIYRESWDRLAEGHAWGHMPGERPFIGVQGKQNGTDATIARVFRGTPADQAGLEAGDLVLMFGGKRVNDFASLQALVQEEQPGNRVKMIVRRDNETVALQLTVGKRPN